MPVAVVLILPLNIITLLLLLRIIHTMHLHVWGQLLPRLVRLLVVLLLLLLWHSHNILRKNSRIYNILCSSNPSISISSSSVQADVIAINRSG